jgi:chemotaxis protein histidine kinase CheA
MRRRNSSGNFSGSNSSGAVPGSPTVEMSGLEALSNDDMWLGSGDDDFDQLAVFNAPARLSVGSSRQSGGDDDGDMDDFDQQSSAHAGSERGDDEEEDGLRDLGQFDDAMSFLDVGGAGVDAGHPSSWALDADPSLNLVDSSAALPPLSSGDSSPEDLDDAAARAALADAEIRLLLAQSTDNSEASAAHFLAQPKQQDQAWHRQHSQQQYRQHHQDEQQRFVEHLQVQAQQLAARQAEMKKQSRANQKLKAAQKKAAQEAAASANQRAAAGVNAAAAAAMAARQQQQQQALQRVAEEPDMTPSFAAPTDVQPFGLTATACFRSHQSAAAAQAPPLLSSQHQQQFQAFPCPPSSVPVESSASPHQLSGSFQAASQALPREVPLAPKPPAGSNSSSNQGQS